VEPIPVFPPKGFSAIVLSALTSIIGIPEIGLTLKIEPEDKILLIENRVPSLP
jgi:hypothetical protein